tara:strand:+ start:495 stop:875 length:381 start_codon:yes stop_codon:yes gene_type:complete
MKKLLIRTGLWVFNCWNLVMDARYNPLRFIPEPSLRAYFTLVLFTMWSIYFGFFATFYMGWLGYSTITSLIVHFAVLIPLFFTHAIFEDAKRDGHRWYLNAMSEEQKRRMFPRKKNLVTWDIDREA